MKKKLFFLPLVAALVLTGCSSEEPEKPAPGVVVGEDGGYIAVNIVAPTNMGGRGTSSDPEFGDDDNKYLEADESFVNNAYFFFFDKDGAQTQIPQEVELTFSKPGTDQPTSPAVERISNAVVVVAGGTAPAQMLVVLNPRAAIINYTGKPMSEIIDRMDIYTNGIEEGNKHFVMSNSTYCDASGNIVTATPIAENNIAESIEEVKSKETVEVYVERVLAKVITNILPSNFTVSDAKDAQNIELGKLGSGAVLPSDNKVSVRPFIKGIEIANVANSSYLFKDIVGCESWTAGWTDWNDEANKRCYWANSTPGLKVNNQSWTAVTDSPSKKNTFYIQENTTGQHSSVLLTAVIQKLDSDGTTWKDFSFVRYLGQYYDFDGFKGQYVTILNNAQWRIRKKVSGGFAYETIPEEYLDWVYNEEGAAATDVNAKAVDQLLGYENTVCFNETGKKALSDNSSDWTLGKGEGVNFNAYRDVTNQVPFTTDDVDATLLEKANRVWFWNKGKCYYYADIEHWGPANSAYAYGIVRNHIYDISFGTLTGLGTPVVDPDRIIVPQKPVDDLFYLQARVNILKWRVVKQSVNFESGYE